MICRFRLWLELFVIVVGGGGVVIRMDFYSFYGVYFLVCLSLICRSFVFD